MAVALLLAGKAAALGEVPVGAVIVKDGEIIARAHNEKERLHDPTAHAEILAIRRAASVCGSWRLAEATLYVTLEPCPMCVGAILQARLGHLVYGAPDAKGGGVESVVCLLAPGLWHHHVEVTAGVMEEECVAVLSSFFREKRTRWS
jgi:tRNA(adenine34) deaminase